MTTRTFTIHPDSQQPDSALVLRCDQVPLDQARISIATGPVRVIGQLANSSNGALLGEINSESGVISVVIKPAMFENPLYDFPWGTLAKREVAAFELSEALGWNLVPPTFLRDVDDMESSVQLFVPHDPREHYFNMKTEGRLRFEMFAVFDYIANNADRKAGHLLREQANSFELFVDRQDDERSEVQGDESGLIYGIDHGLTFHTQDKLRTVIWEFSEKPITEQLLVDVNNAHSSIAARLQPLLEEHEVEATMTRIEKILINPFHRALDANERAFPWPLL